MTSKTLHQQSHIYSVHMISHYYSKYLLIQLEEFRLEKHDGFGIISELSSKIPLPSTPLTIFRPEKLTNIKKCYPTWALYFILLQSIYILFCLLLLEILTDEKHTAADLLKDSAHKSSRLRLVWMFSQFKIFQFKNSELKTKYIAVL